jgi:hypothetical protein
MTLNMDLMVTWNDWRLMYVEGGAACSAASARLTLSGGAGAGDTAAAAAYVQAALLPALQAAWGCASPDECTPALPAGVTPTVSVGAAADATDAGATATTALVVTVYPAPPQPGNDPNGMAAALSAALLAALSAYASGNATLAAAATTSTESSAAAVDGGWVWSPVPCTGADARTLPAAVSLAWNVGAASMGGSADPTTLDPASLWVPQFTDSVNQVSDEEMISEFLHLRANGDVTHTQHFVANFALSMALEAFPFDASFFIATRRSVNYFSDAIAVNVVRAGFAAPQQMEGWQLSDVGSLVCNVRTAAARTAGAATPDDVGVCGADEARSSGCENMLVIYFRAERDSSYYMQNEMAPIVLVTILSAAAYYNDLDAYEQRGGIMATALLSQMALQAYVSASLPQTVEVTFIHLALYTSYALMGFGMAYIVIISYGLALDIAAARKVNMHALDGAASMRKYKRKMWKKFHARANNGGDDAGVRHWQMRQYYSEARTFVAIVRGAPVPPDLQLLYFPDAASFAPRRSVTAAAAAAAPAVPGSSGDTRGKAIIDDIGLYTVSYDLHHDDADHDADAHDAAGGGASEAEARPDARTSMYSVFSAFNGDDDDAEDPSAPPLPYVPSLIWLRMAMLEFDLFMRFGHLGIFCLMIASRYFEILRMSAETRPRCDNLLEYFALP